MVDLFNSNVMSAENERIAQVLRLLERFVRQPRKTSRSIRTNATGEHAPSLDPIVAAQE